MSARIAPLEPPYDDATTQALVKWMPPGSGVEPLALFRTIARHPMLRDRLRVLGAGLLGHGLVAPRLRELAILRTCARCDARYEWGVHVTAFSRAVGIDAETARATALATPAVLASRHDDDALVMRIADALHDRATLPASLFGEAVARFGEPQTLELGAIVGYYHLISYLIGVAGVEPEPWAEPFPAGSGVHS
jgi:4-carboxymuconolactone decarboxylase